MAEVTKVEVVFTGDTAGLSKAATTAESSINRVTKSTAGTVSGLTKLSDTSRRTRAQLSNVSYQLQDIVVQMQAGQKWSVSLGQQLPQLASGFGATGAAIGLVAAVAIPALAIALGSATDDTRTLQEKIDDLSASLAKSSQYFKESQSSAVSLAAGYGALSVEASRLLQSMAELERIKATRELKSALDELTQSFGFLGAAIGATDIKEGISRLGAATKTTEDLEKAFGLTQTQAIQLKSSMQALSETNTLEEQHAAAANLLDRLKEMKPDMAALPPEGLKFAQALQQVLDAIMKIEAGLGGADENIKRAIESAKGLKDPWLKTFEDREAASQRAADILTKNEEKAAAAQLKTAQNSGKGIVDAWLTRNAGIDAASQRSADILTQREETSAAARLATALNEAKGINDAWLVRDQGMQAAMQRGAEMETAEIERAARGEQRQAESAARFAEHLALLGQNELEAINDRQVRLDEAYAQGYLNEQQYADASIALEEAKNRAKSQMTQGALGDLASLMQSGNQKLFKIGQAAAIAEATVSGYESAVEAWRKGMAIGGPPVAAAFTAASLAKTGMLISNIASQSVTGGGGTASTASATTTTAAAEPITSQNVAISVQGDTFSRDSVLTLINSINDAVNDGAIIRVV